MSSVIIGILSISAFTCLFPGYEIGDDGYFYKYHGDKKNWNDAQSVCKNEGGNLAIIFDQNTRDVVRRFMTEGGWIGSSDQWQEGHFETPLRIAIPYSSWADGEPNDDGGEDCTFQRSTNLWNDIKCTSQEPYICQIIPGKSTIY